MSDPLYCHQVSIRVLDNVPRVCRHDTARQTELALCPEARCQTSVCHGATHISICVALSDLATPTATWACARCCVKQRNGRDIDSYLLCLVCRRGGWRTPTATWACARCYCWASWARPWGRPSSAPPGRASAPPSSASPTRRSPCAALEGPAKPMNRHLCCFLCTAGHARDCSFPVPLALFVKFTLRCLRGGTCRRDAHVM